jgi:Asp-tRNA(Asn)/Glu-tRNA(Gln) amidotransferase A subunit family amidase
VAAPVASGAVTLAELLDTAIAATRAVNPRLNAVVNSSPVHVSRSAVLSLNFQEGSP